MNNYFLLIDGELIEACDLYQSSYLPTLDAGRRDWYLALDEDAAEEAMRKVYEDLQNDPDELIALVGQERIVDMWIRGESFADWLDSYVNSDGPAAEFATYDGTTCDVGDEDEMYDHIIAELEVEAEDFVNNFDDDLAYPEDEDANDYEEQCERIDNINRAREIWRGYQELVSDLGYSPTIAYRHN